MSDQIQAKTRNDISVEFFNVTAEFFKIGVEIFGLPTKNFMILLKQFYPTNIDQFSALS